MKACVAGKILLGEDHFEGVSREFLDEFGRR